MSLHDGPWPPGVPCWVELVTSDLAAARRLYGAAFGWGFADSSGPRREYVIASRDGAAAAGVGELLPETVPTSPAWLLHFATDDVDAAAAKAADNGGTVLAEPFDVPGRGRTATVQDPGGTPFRLWQARGHDGCGIVNQPGGLVWEDGRSGDPDAARAFYTALFGFRWTPLGERGAGYHVFVLPDRPDYPLGGLGPVPDGQPPHWLPCFAVDDARAVVAATTAAGGRVVDGPNATPWGLAAGLRDPAGAYFSVMQSSGEGQPRDDGADPAGR
jgi:predicted enzyme related to lactoylglutathione lyase